MRRRRPRRPPPEEQPVPTGAAVSAEPAHLSPFYNAGPALDLAPHSTDAANAGGVVQMQPAATSATDSSLPPVGAFSPSAGLVVDRTGQALRISGNLEIYGAEATAAMAGTIEATIERIWNASFPDGSRVECNVSVSFRATTASASSSATQIEIVRQEGPSYVSSGWGGRYMVLNLNNTDVLNWVVAHEFGHLLGMDDRYLEGWWSKLSGSFGGQRATTIVPGYEGNLMGQHAGALESKNVRDLAEENAPGYFSDDDQVRAWVHNHTSAEIGALSTAAKIQAINVLLGGWVADEDVAAIRAILRSVSARTEAEALRQAIEPGLIDLSSIGQRTQLRVALAQMP